MESSYSSVIDKQFVGQYSTQWHVAIIKNRDLKLNNVILYKHSRKKRPCYGQRQL
jgi:hypothetical protein